MSEYSLFAKAQIPTKAELIALGRHRLRSLLAEACTRIENLPHPHSNYEHYELEHIREDILDILVKEIGRIDEAYRELDDKETEANRIWVEQQLGVKIPKNWGEVSKYRAALRLLRGEALHEVSREFQVRISELKQWRSEFLDRIAKFNGMITVTNPEATLEINDEDYLGLWEWHKSEVRGERAERELVFRRERLSGEKSDYVVAYSTAPYEARHLVTQEWRRFDNYEEAASFCVQLAEKYAPHHMRTLIKDSLTKKP